MTTTPAARFLGLRVASFESRRAADMQNMIHKFGGVPSVSPSLREVPEENPREAIEFAHRVITGQIDVVIFMTGVGTRMLISQIERHVEMQRFLDALKDITTISRSSKPTAALKTLGITPTLEVPEPNTWRELLTTIDKNLSLTNQVVGLQEYGQTNASLIAGLEARGAQVCNLKVYRWELPENVEKLRQNIVDISQGKLDVAMFTSAHQVVNLLRMAQQIGLTTQLRECLSNMVIASIGPTTSEALLECDLRVDLEPEHPKMGHLVAATARNARDLLSMLRAPRVEMPRLPSLPTTNRHDAPWHDSPFMKACRGEEVPHTPIWLMRQAGRYMAEYREVRAKTTFLELCKNPDLCAEVMITAVERLGVDAAIIFSDLLPILEPMGFSLEFAQGEGPVIHNPVRESSDVDRVAEVTEAAQLQFVMDTVRATRQGMADEIPVIGFAGAPFTLASYAIEGAGSRHYAHTKAFMYRDPGAWHELMSKLARSVAVYLNGQIAAGAQAVQLFDSWVGCLNPVDYRRYVLPYSRAIFASLPDDVPTIHFGTGNPALLSAITEAGGSVIGIDWRIDLRDAWKTVGYDKSVQGNMDPAVLLAPTDRIRQHAQRILDAAGGRSGHIFNLGHGILQQTPVENAIALVDMVHEMSAR